MTVIRPIQGREVMSMATAEHKQAARELFEFEKAKALAAGLSRSKANE
jgi:hypothetical protein